MRLRDCPSGSIEAQKESEQKRLVLYRGTNSYQKEPGERNRRHVEQ